jgi:hypothetical protein
MKQVLHMMSGRYSNVPACLKAVQIDDEKHQPVPWLSHLRIHNTQPFWMQRKDEIPVVNQRCFSDLTVVNILKSSRGKSIYLGRVIGTADPQEVAIALIEAEVIQTYVHEESTVHLQETTQLEGAMQISFTGEHVYYTHEENIDPFAFSVFIQADGHLYAQRDA